MRGRSIIFLALIGFFVVATGVIWRRSLGIAQARQLRELEERRTALEAQEAALEGAIRDASSRARLAPIAEEKLGMRVPPESLVIIIPRPERATPRR
ncbi:MAG: cell division protein FtsL [Gemmatimonadaceae bacterium]|nr:cell division protein FtsL [Gemmatimonadaceae bacterium]MCW5824946.1 cell division protein FtsL [Gemmatimonadaceae bacterium]